MGNRRQLLNKAERQQIPGATDTARQGKGRTTALTGPTGASVASHAAQQLGGPAQRMVLVEHGSGAAFEWFGPGTPLNPVAPPQVAGRQLDYPVNYNLTQQPRAYEPVSFEMLRAIADAYDLLRLVIETRKDQIEAFEWNIVARKGMSASESDLKTATAFFLKPDKEHMWSSWLRMILEDLLVIDAVSIYPRLTRGGKLYALELVDGGTVKRVLDEGGRTPLPPDPAYQQVLKGLPAVDYTTEELIYTMRNPRSNRIYGYSPVEQVIMTVNVALRRQFSQLQYFTEGNIPEAIASVPESWNIDTLRQFQIYWDTMLEGNTAQRRHMKFVPFDSSKIKEMRADLLKDQFDEWLARIICFAFSIPATSLVKETNRATAQTTADTAKEEGLIPLLNYLRHFFNDLLATVYGDPRLEFKWDEAKDLAPREQAEVDRIYLESDVYDTDHVRERLGLPPLTPAQKAEIEAKRAAAAPAFGAPPGSKPGEGDAGFPASEKKPKEEPVPPAKKAAESTTIIVERGALRKTVTDPEGREFIIQEEEQSRGPLVKSEEQGADGTTIIVERGLVRKTITAPDGRKFIVQEG